MSDVANASEGPPMPLPPAVRWERLRLEGFGRHRDLRVRFPPGGLAVWVAPNEAGKSTAVLGLVATVWGLPHLQETAGFAWGRFRAFDGGPHRGEVTFARGSERFTVTRAFDSHRVRVVRHAVAGDEELLEAEHNPNARREASAYLPWLRATLGIDDAPLVLATFVVAQGDLGGPPHQLGRQVQELLAGAGGGTAHEAAGRLEAALRAITRRVKGLAPELNRDGRQDQALELAEARLQELTARWAAGREAADAFADLQVRAEAAAKAARTAEEEAHRLRAAADARRAWIDLREAAARAARRAADLRRAVDAAGALAGQLAAARGVVAATHPELAGIAAAGFDERLSAWASAEAAVAVQEKRLAAAREARDAALREAHDEVAAALARERAVGAAARASSATGTGPVAVGRTDADPARAGDASSVTAWAAAEAAARRWREGLATVRREQARAAEAEAELAMVAPLAGLDEAERPDLRGYREEVAAWAGRLSEAEAAWEGWRDRLAEADERFGDVAALDPVAAADLLAFARADERPDGAAPWRAAVPAVAAVAAGATASVAVGWPYWASALLAAGVWAALFLVWPRRPALRRARRRLDAWAAAGETLLAGDDDHRRTLARRREVFEGRRDDLATLGAGERAAAERLARVRDGAASFRARWEPWRAALIAIGHDEDVDLGAANEVFERASGEAAAARARAAAAARAVGVDDPRMLAAEAHAAAAGPDGARVHAWAVARGALDADADVAALDDWLSRLSSATWSAWREAAVRADAAEAERARAHEARRLAEEQAERAAREQERNVLREERALADAAAARRAARAAALAGFTPGGRAAPAPVVEAPARPGADATAGAPTAHPAADPTASPEALRRAWRERREAERHADALDQRLAAHLAAVGATDLDTLTGAADGADLEATEALRAWRAVVAEHPSLPPADLAATDGGAAGPHDEGRHGPTAAFAATAAAAAQAERVAADAQQAAAAAHDALLRAQAGDPIDVAAIELEIAEARADAERWAFERDAVALAARELAAASAGFREGHAERLAEAAGAHLAGFGGVTGRRVRLDAELRADVVEHDGRRLSVGQLSQGARDQLALALRLAVADLMAGDLALPLVLDDPFLNWDEDRAEAAARALQAVTASGRQVWLLSHRAELAGWGETVAVDGG